MHQAKPVVEQSTTLYEDHAPAVLNYLLRKLGSREDAEDILLDVFTVVLEKGAGLRDKRAIRAWILTIARNKVADHYRRFERHARVPLAEIEETVSVSEDREPEQVFLRQETSLQLQKHLRTLSKIQQEILLLRFGEGLRCAEIAQVLGKSENAARGLLFRTLQKLRDMYGKERAERGL